MVGAAAYVATVWGWAGGVLGGVEEVELQLADRVLEHLNNAGGQTEGCSIN
jgi:hypothetical protein